MVVCAPRDQKKVSDMRQCLVCDADLDAIGKNKKAIYCSKLCKQRYLTKKNYTYILEKNKAWYKRNKDSRLQKCSNYYKTLTEEQRQIKLEQSRLSYNNRKHTGMYIVRSVRRHAAKLKRTPTWLTEYDLFFIEEIYHLAKLRSDILGIKYEIDHIIPLQGKLVSGLHVPNNLQILPRSENRRKGNR